MRYRVCVSVHIRTLEHETFVTADSRADAEEMAITEAIDRVLSGEVDTQPDAWQCEECSEEDEARIRAEDGE